MAETADDTFVLRDLVPAEPLLPQPGHSPWVWLAIASAVIAIAALVIFLVRRKTNSLSDPRKLRDEAYAAALRDLDAATPDEGVQTSATRISLVLRRYLATVGGDPALFETHEEFVSRHESLASLPEELRKAASEEFSHLARLKYGREANDDPVALFSTARDLLSRLHQHQPS